MKKAAAAKRATLAHNMIKEGFGEGVFEASGSYIRKKNYLFHLLDPGVR